MRNQPTTAMKTQSVVTKAQHVSVWRNMKTMETCVMVWAIISARFSLRLFKSDLYLAFFHILDNKSKFLALDSETYNFACFHLII